MNPFIKALYDYYNAQISESLATLNVYLSTPAGLGNKTDIFAEIRHHVDVLNAANSKLETLNKYISVNVNKQTEENKN